MTTEDKSQISVASSAQTVGQVMHLYSTMIHGQIVANAKLTHADKVAAILCAADVLNKAHAQAITKLCELKNVSPSYVVGEDKAKETAEVYARAMVGER